MCRWVEHFAARRAVGHEITCVGFRLYERRPRFLTNHGRAGGHIVCHDRSSANARTFANGNWPKNLRARTDDDIIQYGRMPLSTNSRGRIGAAKRDILIHGDIVADFRRFANDAETVIQKEIAADFRARVNVDTRQETRKVIDQPRQKKHLAQKQPVRDAVITYRPNAGI